MKKLRPWEASLRFNFSQAFGHCISQLFSPCFYISLHLMYLHFTHTLRRTCQSLTVNHALARVPNAKTAVLIENPQQQQSLKMHRAYKLRKKGRHEQEQKRKQQPLTQKTTVDRNRKNASRRRRDARFLSSPAAVVEPPWNEGALFVNSWDSGLKQVARGSSIFPASDRPTASCRC